MVKREPQENAVIQSHPMRFLYMARDKLHDGTVFDEGDTNHAFVKNYISAIGISLRWTS